MRTTIKSNNSGGGSNSSKSWTNQNYNNGDSQQFKNSTPNVNERRSSRGADDGIY